MKKERLILLGVISFLLFLFIIILVTNIDVKPIGPDQSIIGLSTINQYVFELFGVHLIWYHITDWLGLVAILVAFIFAVVGFVQLVKRRSFLKVDKDITLLGIFYIVVISIYIFFEMNIINYRPVIIYEGLEASFPSSHTFIVMFIMLTAIIQCKIRIKNRSMRITLITISYIIILVTVIGRLISGVHWITDITAGIILSTSLMFFYKAILVSSKKSN
jgi:undecaprenyl-diphosphatase